MTQKNEERGGRLPLEKSQILLVCGSLEVLLVIYLFYMIPIILMKQIVGVADYHLKIHEIGV
tara:strand:- start:330 stop:515 length:186 start_codon:yes stop_codon:yes gene_type:complete